MRILFIARAYPPTTGGMERFAYDLQAALSNTSEVQLIKWGGRKLYLPVVLPLMFIKASYRLMARPVDVIHVQDGLLAPMGLLLKVLFNKPLTVVIHGLDITYGNRLYQAVVPRCLMRADKIFCISQAAAQEVRKRHIPGDKVEVIPLGITDDLFMSKRLQAKKHLSKALTQNLENKILLLTVGRLVKRKGVHWFVSEVLPSLSKSYPRVVYIVVGEGEYREAIERAVQKAGLQSRVLLLGRADDRLLKQIYNAADIFIMPNMPVKGDMEGFGRVLLEAALCKLPIVASALEGIKDAITPGQNGVLVHPKDKAQYLKAISQFIKNKDRARKFGAKSRSYTLQRYSWPAVSQQYLRVYRSLLASGSDQKPEDTY